MLLDGPAFDEAAAAASLIDFFFESFCRRSEGSFTWPLSVNFALAVDEEVFIFTFNESHKYAETFQTYPSENFVKSLLLRGFSP